jgi:hypothetical protein
LQFFNVSAQDNKNDKTPLEPYIPRTNAVCNDICSLVQANVNNLVKTPKLTFKGVVNDTVCYNVPSSINYGCLNSARNKSWFLVKITEAGAMTFTIGNTNNFDVDAALWGPVSANDLNNTCVALSSAPLDCDYSYVANAVLDIPSAQVGQYYVLMVANFSNKLTDITITQPSSGGVSFEYVCPDDLFLDSDLNGTMHIAANEYIESKDRVNTGNITYTAGKAIELKPGFKAPNTSNTPINSTVFLAKIQGCKTPQTIYESLYLQPGPTDGQDADINLIVPNQNSGNTTFIDPYAWTQSGDINIKRAYIKFNFSSIPTNAIVDSAYLSLYFSQDLIDRYPIFTGHYGDNALSINKILSIWDESTITWNTKPDVDETLSIFIAAAATPKQDYPKIDVKSLVQNMLGSNNQGFAIRHRIEEPYKITCLTTSEEVNPAKRPKIIVYYHYSNN